MSGENPKIKQLEEMLGKLLDKSGFKYEYKEEIICGHRDNCCPKCKKSVYTVFYHPDNGFYKGCRSKFTQPHNEMKKEHLHYYCHYCRYDWCEEIEEE
ncbi:MAG: hypothetical protein GXO75_08365 [Calditrichaeota bacterium]|nr:hypothetical protein [Calditrichota bacterium]